MKRIYLILTAAASLVMASCVSDDLGNVETVSPSEGTYPIYFNSSKGATTRAGADITGADAASLLGNKFVVSGYKGTKTSSVGSIVFDNYLVEWSENSAHTTESNTNNWEYVGKGLIKHAENNGITNQTIKYWDYSNAQYDFIAWSTGAKTAIYEGTPAAGEVLVSAIAPSDATTAAYTFTGTAEDLSACYIADLVTVKKAKYGDNPVTFKFRQLGTKVRIGIYETVPGYSVKDVKFYTLGGLLTDPSAEIVNNATIFSGGADIYKEGTYTVSFPTVDSPTNTDNNLAHVSFTPKSGVAQTTLVDFGTMNYTLPEDGEKKGDKFLGRTSATASYAGKEEDNYYVIYLPNETGANLNLRVDFTLESTDGSGEEIFVKNAKAQVPSIYTTWKPGYAYTYLFKINDKTNGRTGVYDPTQADDATINSDPAGLYPITFDALVMDSEKDGTQETITSVSTPSITTYQQKSTVVNANEYTANGNDIFVTVNENDDLVTLTGKANLYTIPDGKTEAEVVDALSMQVEDNDPTIITGRSGLVLKDAEFSLVDSVKFGADGNAIKVGINQALRFTPTAPKTYAFVYTKTVSTTDTEKFQPITFTAGADVEGYYRYDYKASAGDAQKGVKYFSVASGIYKMETAFIGQGVSNLYLDDHGTIASGYAVTGTAYYYTLDHGQTYKTAVNIAYVDFKNATDLYTFNSTTSTYTLKTETSPADGTAYYQKKNVGGVDTYTYCVILPQQTDSWFELDETAAKVACATGEKAIAGQTYFDRYVQNNGEYYTKVIKIQ